MHRGVVQQALDVFHTIAAYDTVDTFVLSTAGNEAEDAPDDVKGGVDAFPPGFLDRYLPLYQVRRASWRRPVHGRSRGPRQRFARHSAARRC